jgi:hypothetical protein
MKLRSGKILLPLIVKAKSQPQADLTDVASTINITRSIKKELKKYLDQLKEILENNLEFAKVLVEKSLLIGKGVYTNEIKDLIFKQYAHYFYTDNGYDKRGSKLLDITFDLGELIYGDHELVKKELKKHPQKEWNKYKNLLRNEIEHEVENIFFSEENIKTDIMGVSTDQYNEF